MNFFRLFGLASLLLAGLSFGAMRMPALPVAAVSLVDPPVVGPGPGNADSMGGEFSGDGRFFVFISSADNLVTNDANGFIDVFARDLSTRTTQLVSVNLGGTGSGRGDSVAPSVSASGRWIAFESDADDLVTKDTNGVSDVFARDLLTGETFLVSTSYTNTVSVSGPSSAPAISPDGRYVAFESLATNLVAGIRDTNGASDLFIRDLQNGVTLLVSKQWNTNRTANGASTQPAFSADGSRLVFTSTATNLVSGVTNTGGDIYVRDLPNAATIWVSRNAASFRSALTNGAIPPTTSHRCYNPAISANGRYVAFKMVLDLTSVPAGILRHDLLTGGTDLVDTNLPGAFSSRNDLSGPVMSADGRFVAYEGRPARGIVPAALPLVWLWDAETLQTKLVSVNLAGTGLAIGLGNTGSDTPAISADGRYVAFLSYATNLVNNVVNNLCQVYVRDLTAGVTKLVSARPDGAAGQDADTAIPVFSPDGRYVTFQSIASDLVADDFNGAYDVFIRDLTNDLTELVSVGWPSLTPAGISSAGQNGLSADGRWLAFTSLALNVAPNDTNNLPDVFVRDLVSKSNLLISVNADGTGSANGLSRDPIISADGQVVVFTSFASNLVAGFSDANQAEDVFFRFVQTGVTECVVPGNASAAKGTSAPSLSADGKYCAFQSSAALPTEAFVGADVNSFSDIYVRCLVSGTNTLVSLNFARTAAGNRPSELPTISPDSQWVVFQSRATDLVSPPLVNDRWQFYAHHLGNLTTRQISAGLDVPSLFTNTTPALFSHDSNSVVFPWNRTNLYLHSIEANQTSQICSNCAEASVSADGRWIAFQSTLATGANKDIFVRDMQTGSNILASANLAGAGGGNGDSSTPLISADGRFVVFMSKATNLVANDTNAWTDVFARDLVVNTTIMVSVNPSGAPANRLSSTAVMGADGRTVIFNSFASNLADGDLNNTKDVFLLKLNAGDLDQDALPDDWEVAYFGNLQRDGTGDYDSDGVSDRDEYRAGTNPSSNPVFTLLTLTKLTTGEVTLIWSAIPGRTYRVQFKNTVDDPAWTYLPGNVASTGSQASAMDSTADMASQRFYRVVMVE